MSIQQDTFEREAYALGCEHAQSAATWTVDGNTASEHVERIARMFDDGDPALFDYLPPRPDLSGQWADGLTQRSLVEQVTGLSGHAEATWNMDAYDAVCGAICEAYERGVSDTFEQACEAEIRRALS